jgi:hypothetical protein
MSDTETGQATSPAAPFPAASAAPATPGLGLTLLMAGLYLIPARELALIVGTGIEILPMGSSSLALFWAWILVAFGAVTVLAVLAIGLAHRRDRRFRPVGVAAWMALLLAGFSLPASELLAGEKLVLTDWAPLAVDAVMALPAIAYLLASRTLAARFARPPSSQQHPGAGAGSGTMPALVTAGLYLVLVYALIVLVDVFTRLLIVLQGLTPFDPSLLWRLAGFGALAVVTVRAILLGFEGHPRFLPAALAAWGVALAVAVVRLAVGVAHGPAGAGPAAMDQLWVAIAAIGCLAVGIALAMRPAAPASPP